MCVIWHLGVNFFHPQEEGDLPYEEEILRHPYQLKCWLRYIEHKADAPKAVINLIYERSLKQLPGRCALNRYSVPLH